MSEWRSSLVKWFWSSNVIICVSHRLAEVSYTYNLNEPINENHFSLCEKDADYAIVTHGYKQDCREEYITKLVKSEYLHYLWTLNLGLDFDYRFDKISGWLHPVHGLFQFCLSELWETCAEFQTNSSSIDKAIVFDGTVGLWSRSGLSIRLQFGCAYCGQRWWDVRIPENKEHRQ